MYLEIPRRTMSDSSACPGTWSQTSTQKTTPHNRITSFPFGEAEAAKHVHFNFRLKPTLSELNDMSLPSQKKDRRYLKIKALKEQYFPISNQTCLETLFDTVSKMKKLHAKSNDSNKPGTFPLSIGGESCEVDIYPFYDTTGTDGKEKLRHEAVFSFVYPSTKKIDKSKHLVYGSCKFISYGWLMGKQPKRFVRAVTPFEETGNSDGLNAAAFRQNQTKFANNEAIYLKLFNQKTGFAQAYKSHNLENKNILLMTHYPSDLFDKINKAEKIDDYSKIQTLIEIFSPISTMHAMKVCHRDIKFENFLLDAQEHPLVCDFGACCKSDNLKEINEPRGTIPCMSPERLDNYFYNTKLSEKDVLATDIWAAGQMALFVLWNVSIPTFEINKTNFQEDIEKARNQIVLLSEYEPPKEDLLTHLIWETLHIESSKRPSASNVVERLTAIKNQYNQDNHTYSLSKTNNYWENLLQSFNESSADSLNSMSEGSYSDSDSESESDGLEPSIPRISIHNTSASSNHNSPESGGQSAAFTRL